MARIVTWASKEEAQKQLVKRLQFSKEQKNNMLSRWQENERLVYNTKGGSLAGDGLNINIENISIEGGGVDQGDGSIGTNYLFKNLRLIHAQMSANPPSVIPRPTSNDPEDRRRADAADRVIRYAMRQYNLQEKVDQSSLNTLLYGTSFIKVMWDTEAGDILGLDEETGEMEMEGDISVSVPTPWDIFVDPEATTWEDVRFVFERVYITYEEACYLYPEAKELLKAHRITNGNDRVSSSETSRSDVRHRYYDSVELYQYWEKGLPVNGYLGRFCLCTKDGQVLGDVSENPEKYKVPSISGKTSFAKAVLPFIPMTDIDVPNSLWGKSFVEFGTSLQDNLNRLDTVLLENVQAHGVARIILPEGSEISDDSITNSPWDVIKITGNQPPSFMSPMPLPAGMSELRANMKMGVDDISGVNESMFGQQSRETSGFSMQYATNQGNMIRRRLFNKYTLFAESLYKRILQITQMKWDIPRTIHVLGKEKSFEATDIKGADLDSGYDLVVEYGSSFSLDPTMRREEILTLMPVFEKAGMTPKEILNKLKLNELPNMHDSMDLANDRQREIFEEMVASGIYIQPEELQDHANMLAFGYTFVMTTEFKYLQDEQKALIRQHIKDREMLAAQEQASAANAGGVPGPAPQGAAGAPPALPGSAGPLDITQLMGGM